MRILGDGVNTPVTCEMFANSKEKPNIPTLPREIYVNPLEGSVKPMSQIYLEVTIFYIARQVKPTFFRTFAYIAYNLSS